MPVTPDRRSHKPMDRFRRFADQSAHLVGSAPSFLVAILVVVAWAATGPVFHYSDTWQLVINTGTSVVTFLVVFVIQNSQNRDARAMQLKLDELLRAIDAARTGMIRLEHLPEVELRRLEEEFRCLRKTRPTESNQPSVENGGTFEPSGAG